MALHAPSLSGHRSTSRRTGLDPYLAVPVSFCRASLLFFTVSTPVARPPCSTLVSTSTLTVVSWVMTAVSWVCLWVTTVSTAPVSRAVRSRDPHAGSTAAAESPRSKAIRIVQPPWLSHPPRRTAQGSSPNLSDWDGRGRDQAHLHCQQRHAGGCSSQALAALERRDLEQEAPARQDGPQDLSQAP